MDPFSMFAPPASLAAAPPVEKAKDSLGHGSNKRDDGTDDQQHADMLRDRANKASKKANDSGNSADHQAASDAHDEAAMASHVASRKLRANGDRAAAREYAARAEEHLHKSQEHDSQTKAFTGRGFPPRPQPQADGGAADHAGPATNAHAHSKQALEKSQAAEKDGSPESNIDAAGAHAKAAQAHAASAASHCDAACQQEQK